MLPSRRSMLSLVSSAVCALMIAHTSPAGEPWITQSPYPADGDLLSVCFVNADTGWIVGDDRIVMGTTDGGQTWSQSPSVQRRPQFYDDPFWDVVFVDELHGWTMGNSPHYRTVDGGATWQMMPDPVGSWYGCDFVSPQVGFTWSNYGAMKTTNGGDSWGVIWPIDLDHLVTSVDFFDENLGLLSGADNGALGMYRTTDGGETWAQISNLEFYNLHYLSENIVIGTRGGASFYRSTDGGATWSLMYSENTEFNNAVEEIAIIDADSIAAIDINVRIWISDDAGVTWTRTQDVIGNWGYDWSIQFPDATTGYAAGRNGLIYKSTDGGHSWAQISNGAAVIINDLDMHDSGTGVAVGENGTVLHTTDFGRRWTAAQLPDSFGIAEGLNTVQGIDQDTWVCAGEFGAFFRSTDGGASWSLQPRVDVERIYDAWFLDADEGWIVGEQYVPWGFVMHTTDGGTTWQRVDEPGDFYVVTDVQVMPSQRGWLLKPQTSAFISDDAFQTVDFRELPSGDVWQSFSFASDNVGWIGGFFGGVVKTTDGGYWLEEQTLPGIRWQDGDRLLDIYALDPQTAYAATYRSGAIFDGRVFETNNGGTTWSALPTITVPTNQGAAALSAIDVISGGAIWTTGGVGFIFARELPPVSNTVLPSSFNTVFGAYQSGTLNDLYDSDDSSIVIQQRPAFSILLPLIRLEVDGVAGVSAPSQIVVTVEAGTNALPTQSPQELLLFNYDTNLWELVDERTATVSDSVVEVTVDADPGRFIDDGTNAMRMRIDWFDPGNVFSPAWVTRTDQAVWTVLP